jgi:hypothetical protein
MSELEKGLYNLIDKTILDWGGGGRYKAQLSLFCRQYRSNTIICRRKSSHMYQKN